MFLQDYDDDANWTPEVSDNPEFVVEYSEDDEHGDGDDSNETKIYVEDEEDVEKEQGQQLDSENDPVSIFLKNT